MDVIPVKEILLENRLGNPTLNALISNVDTYEVLLLQPHGDIEADENGVRNRDHTLAINQYSLFLEDANKKQADLLITPEYSMPWSVLETVIKEGQGPTNGKLWALGCESIKISELDALKSALDSVATVIYEPLDSFSPKFVSPLAYVFKAPIAANLEESRTVILVQFKTEAMGDVDHFENIGMQKGTHLYLFGGDDASIKLVSLICADAFGFEDTIAKKIHDRALILHIQLNPNPRHESFLACRSNLLRYSRDETEILCINWASDVIMEINGQDKSWKTIAGSAWYLKTKDFDESDHRLCANHRLGLYYTYLQPHRSHALFFNYEPATFLLTATKVAHIGVPGSASKRTGPRLTRTCTWNNEANKWIVLDAVDDGFSTLVDEGIDAQSAIKQIADTNPFNAERIMALSSGEINKNRWYEVKSLDSCVIELPEVVRRITFAQDMHEDAIKFRTSRLQRFSRLWNIIEQNDLPPSINDLKGDFEFQWSPNNPQQNIKSSIEKYATVIYVGEDSTIPQIEKTVTRVNSFIYESSSDINQCISAQQRFHIWYRDNNDQIVLYEPHRNLNYDQTGDESPVDIGREQ
ncbi:hypothetical protein [Methanolobus profundi]|nr:hypothetical protein [Methanolobus profundi]